MNNHLLVKNIYLCSSKRWLPPNQTTLHESRPKSLLWTSIKLFKITETTFEILFLFFFKYCHLCFKKKRFIKQWSFSTSLTMYSNPKAGVFALVQRWTWLTIKFVCKASWLMWLWIQVYSWDMQIWLICALGYNLNQPSYTYSLTTIHSSF